MKKKKRNEKWWDGGEKQMINELNTLIHVFAHGNMERGFRSANLWAVVYGLIPQLFHFLSLSHSPSFCGESLKV